MTRFKHGLERKFRACPLVFAKTKRVQSCRAFHRQIRVGEDAKPGRASAAQPKPARSSLTQPASGRANRDGFPGSESVSQGPSQSRRSDGSDVRVGPRGSSRSAGVRVSLRFRVEYGGRSPESLSWRPNRSTGVGSVSLGLSHSSTLSRSGSVLP